MELKFSLPYGCTRSSVTSTFVSTGMLWSFLKIIFIDVIFFMWCQGNKVTWIRRYFCAWRHGIWNFVGYQIFFLEVFAVFSSLSETCVRTSAPQPSLPAQGKTMVNRGCWAHGMFYLFNKNLKYLGIRKKWEIRELWTIISSKGLFLTDPASFGMLTTDEPRVPQRRSQFYIPVVSPDSNQPPEPPPREYKWWNISAWRGHYELSQWQEARQQEGAPFPNTFVPISPIGQSAVMV